MVNILTKTYPSFARSTIKETEGILTKKTLLSKSFLTNKENKLFLSLKNSYPLSILKLNKKKNNGYLIEILFHGFNYSSKRYKLLEPKYSIDTHKSELFICDEPITTTFKSRIHKRRLIFFSYDHDLLDNIKKIIKNFKRPDSYTGKGLFERNDSYSLKQRKKRK